MTDISAAKQTAKRLFKKYNFQDGPLGSYEISALLKDTYDFLQIPFNPTQNDIKGYGKVLDADNDGQVTLKDLQTLAIQYLCGDSAISKPVAPSSYPQTFQKNEYTYSNMTEKFQSSSYKQPQMNYESSSGYNFEPKTAGNRNKQGFEENYRYEYSNNGGNEQSSWQPNQSAQNYQIDHSYANKYQSTHADNYDQYDQYDQSAYNNQQYNNQQYSNQEYQQYDNQQYQQYDNYQQEQNNDRPYSDLIRQYLSIVGQVFLKYADKVTYTVTQSEVPDLLTDTYAVLGRQGYYPSSQDVKTWMKLCDVNQDGKVEYQDYEFFVVKSLQRSGVDLYD